MKQAATPFDGINPKKRKNRESPRRVEENSALRQTIGERLEAARKLNVMTQAVAAEKIGYANSTQLSLAEAGKRLTPISILMRASTVYGVSVDYLTGVSDEPERDPKAAERHAALRHVGDLLGDVSNVIVHQVQRYLSAGAPSVMATRSLLTRADECIAAIESLQRLNRDAFEGDMKGAAAVLRTMDALMTSVKDARLVLDRHDRVGLEAIATAERRAGISHPLFDQLDKEEARLL